MTGNRIIVKFGGDVIGMVQDLRCSDDYGLEPVSGIGDIHIVEYVPTMARHTLHVSQMVLSKGSILANRGVAKNANDMLKGLVVDFEIWDRGAGVATSENISGLGTMYFGDGGFDPNYDNLPNSDFTSKLIRKYRNCYYGGGDWEFRKHAIMVTSATYYATDANSDFGQSG